MLVDKVIINRSRIEHDFSLGRCYLKMENGIIIDLAASLERGWRGNQKRISCVPEGVYPLIYEKSDKFRRNLWELKNVPNRAECKFHVANYWYQLEGCIALGKNHRDIDHDGRIDVTSSTVTMRRFHELMSNQTKCIIEVKNIK